MSLLKACVDVIECILHIFWQAHIITMHSINKLNKLTDWAYFSQSFSHKTTLSYIEIRKVHWRHLGISIRWHLHLVQTWKSHTSLTMTEAFSDDQWCTGKKQSESARRGNFTKHDAWTRTRTELNISTAAISHLRAHSFSKHSGNDGQREENPPPPGEV